MRDKSKIEKGIRRKIRRLIGNRSWEEITAYVNSMPEAWMIWSEEWERSEIEWPRPEPQGIYAEEELIIMGRLKMRRIIKSRLNMGAEECGDMTLEELARAICAANIHKPDIPPPPRPTPPYEKSLLELLDYLFELAYRTFHVHPEHYLRDCITTFQSIKGLCTEYNLDLEDILREREWVPALTCKAMFDNNQHRIVYTKIMNGEPYSELLHPKWADEVNGTGYWETNIANEYYNHFKPPAYQSVLADIPRTSIFMGQ